MRRVISPELGPEGTFEFAARTFAVALHEGLSRVTPPWAAPGQGAAWSSRPRPPAAHIALLRAHREEILTDLADALAAAPATAGHADARQPSGPLVDWARAVLAAADGHGTPSHLGGKAPLPPAPQLELTVATLLLECTVRRLPDVPARELALRALGRALRGDHVPG
ncbi:hypothetical protein [Streptomyces sp. GC420]|uniref:hypothetical protein n=1 Tax=Streptomyces sp. GC420 TaxID=2697568 RepID=UPI001414F005|nr:hypothetical protein [Streptomyces sp. GC420]NBM18396.1 hypothetical protein [Streptomyces sp. GC420]